MNRFVWWMAFVTMGVWGPLWGGNQLPVVADVDVVVVGGSVEGVAAAVAAKSAGAKVYLVAPRPYLGEDLAGKLRLVKEADDDLSHSFASALYQLKGEPTHRFGDTTPLRIKQAGDEAMRNAGIPFLAWTSPCGVLRDERGRVAGVVVANRNGRQVVKAKAIVDATERASVARWAGAKFRPFPAGEYPFTRYVVTDAPPRGVKSTAMTTPTLVDAAVQMRMRQLAPGYGTPSVVTARLWKCELRLPMADGSAKAFAAAEQRARDLTWTPAQVDAADTLEFNPPDRLEQSVEAVIVSGPVMGPLPPGRSVIRGEASGRAAAQLAAKCGELKGVRVVAVSNDSLAEGEVVGEATRGVEGTLRQGSGEVPVASEALPELGTFDVVVAGGGTSGAPAGIAAARHGWRTLVLEYSHRLGGVMTDGGIGLYCFGLRVGFTDEVDHALKHFGSVYGVAKAEWFRSELRKAGAEIWFGTMVEGVVRRGNRVTGVVVVMPDGTRGMVRCQVAIDATGNADLASAAGEPTEFIGSDELSLQGAGCTPRILGYSYQNTDSTFIDDTDVADLCQVWRRARASFGSHVWDQSQVINSRERRRMVGVFRVSVQDAMGGRTYPDVIAVTKSNFDTHGQTVDPQFFIEDPGHDATVVYLPYRCLLPQRTEGLLTIGLGMSADRDAMPILRMQPDVQNQGYAAGTAAALALRTKRDLRSLNIKELQRELVELKIVPAEVLSMTDNRPYAQAQLEAAVRTLPEQYRGLSVVLSEVERARPLLVVAFEREQRAEAQLVYAHVLGLVGDNRGAKVLAAKLDSMKWDSGWNFRGMCQFGRSVSWVDSYLIALGRSRAKTALAAVVAKARAMSEKNAYSHFRAIALAFEGIGDPAGIPELVRLLKLEGVSGHALNDDAGAITRIAGYERNSSHLGIGERERTLCLRELCLARALYNLGDAEGLGERLLRSYAEGSGRAYANHAQLVLAAKRGPKPTERYAVIYLGFGPKAKQYPVVYRDGVPEGGWRAEHRRAKLVLREMPGEAGDLMGIFEVTQAQFALVTGEKPSKYHGADRPAEYVGYDMCCKFLRLLSERTGLKCRLPSEAEWRHACGSLSEVPLARRARYFENRLDGRGETEHTSVGSYEPNEFGIYDMLGNVWEWCQMEHDNDRKAPLRGGGWEDGEEVCTPSARLEDARINGGSSYGFRVWVPAARNANRQ